MYVLTHAWFDDFLEQHLGFLVHATLRPHLVEDFLLHRDRLGLQLSQTPSTTLSGDFFFLQQRLGELRIWRASLDLQAQSSFMSSNLPQLVLWQRLLRSCPGQFEWELGLNGISLFTYTVLSRGLELACEFASEIYYSTANRPQLLWWFPL